MTGSDMYLAVAVTTMFGVGIVWMLLTARNQSVVRKR
jgi:hypothetical protein